MSRETRLRDLEKRKGGGERPTFRIAVPPPGLTAAEHDRWSADRKREAAARGEYSFTLDLGASVIQ